MSPAAECSQSLTCSTPPLPQEGTFNPPTEADNHPFDPLFNVQWPVPEGVQPIMSPKDTAAPPLTVRRPHLVGLAPRRRVLVIGGSDK